MNLGILKTLSGLFSRKPKTTAEVIEVAGTSISKVVKAKSSAAIKGMAPSETIAFGLPKPPSGDYFVKLKTDIDASNKLVNTLSDKSSPRILIEHAQNKMPLRYDSKVAPRQQYKDPKLVDRYKDREIEKILKKATAEKAAKIQDDLFTQWKKGHIPFSETKITDPDKILALIKSDKYNLAESSLFKALSKTGNEFHAGIILSDLKAVADKNREQLSKVTSLSDKIATIGIIGNKPQQQELIVELQKELAANNDQSLARIIFNGVGEVGKVHPEKKDFAKILFDNIKNNNPHRVMAYENLVHFDNTFIAVHEGMKSNPSNRTILGAAYESAKTAEEKAYLLQTILEDSQLIETAISTKSSIAPARVQKSYKADILSQIFKEKFNNLSANFQSELKKALNIK